MQTKKILTTEQLEDAKRLKALYESKKKQLNVTQYTIADDIGISQGAVGHYMNGRIALNVPMVTAFARILQVQASDISPSLAREVSKYASTVDENVSGFRPYVPGVKYPVISKVQAGAWAEACEAYTLKDIDLWLGSDAHIQGDAFWLEVEGDSMTAPAGVSIPEGTFVLFDTGRDAINNSLVIAKLSDSNEATFKRLIIDGGQKYLKGLNPQWPMVPINGNCKIIGVAVETKMRLV
ncbi:peptidase S24 [bacteria symbiont BFo1 of Frankliniella occidentalis]|nr:peptidase S24 [bacteria symbiont BFo1 of Frankliniella occidentalis]KYP84493.1 peptidase S24 [bacteria symbiont BFo1 of Frankliniella occidentalis]